MKVTRIIDPQYKSGTSAKTGKQWTLIKIETEGKEATGFGPVAPGDEVDLTFDEKYKNYSFKVLRPSDIPDAAPGLPAGGTKMLQLIYDDIQEILKLVKSKSLGETWNNVKEADRVVEDIGDEPMNIDDIPF